VFGCSPTVSSLYQPGIIYVYISYTQRRPLLTVVTTDKTLIIRCSQYYTVNRNNVTVPIFQTRLPSNLRPTTRECVQFSYAWSLPVTLQ